MQQKPAPISSVTRKCSDYFFAAAASDIHLHHPRTPTSLIIANLDRDILCNPIAKELDLIWIPGDLLDRLLTVPDHDNYLITAFVCRLLRFCKKHDICLRILEGTGSHDYGQSQIVMTLNEHTGIDADVRYYHRISYDYEERFGFSVLYVPDEVNSDATITWHQVQEVLRDHGVEKVDYAIMHGMFEFQLPQHVNDISAHLSERYESIVRKRIIIGHHHTHRIQGKVIVPGSFDRLAQNEEGPKGSIWLRDYGDRVKVEFLENVGAKTYLQLSLHGKSIEEAISTVDEFVKDHRPGSAFLIKAMADDPAAKAMDLFKSRYEQFVWTHAFEREDKTTARLEEIELTYNPRRIDSENVVELLMERFKQTTASPQIQDRAVRLLETVL